MRQFDMAELAAELAAELESFADEMEHSGYVSPADKARMAQTLREGCIAVSEEVVKETDDDSAEAYIVDHLKILAASGHGFISRDFNFDDWIERLEGRGEDDEDEEED